LVGSSFGASVGSGALVASAGASVAAAGAQAVKMVPAIAVADNLTNARREILVIFSLLENF
jgi:hypothetical protein